MNQVLKLLAILGIILVFVVLKWTVETENPIFIFGWLVYALPLTHSLNRLQMQAVRAELDGSERA